MANSFKGTNRSSAKDIAKKVAAQVVREPIEILKSAPAQIIGKENQKNMPVMQKNIKDNKPMSLTPQEIAQRENWANKRLAELEQELIKLRQERIRKQVEYAKRISQEMGGVQSEGLQKKIEPLVEPSTRPKRGFLGFIGKKQGTKEMGKRVSD